MATGSTPKKQITTTKDVLHRYLAGAATAAKLARSKSGGAGGKKKGRAKIKHIKPPRDGWK